MNLCAYTWNRKHRFQVVDIQNATLSGGVAVGAIADLMIGPGGAFCMGTITGVISAFGYRILQVKWCLSNTTIDCILNCNLCRKSSMDITSILTGKTIWKNKAARYLRNKQLTWNAWSNQCFSICYPVCYSNWRYVWRKVNVWLSLRSIFNLSKEN